MLVLGRHVGEWIVITLEDGSTINIQLVDTRRGEAKLAFEARKSIQIDRFELLEEKQANARLAAKGGRR